MRDGYVYVVQAIGGRFDSWVKIGWAKDIARRMATVSTQCGSDLALLGCFAGTQREETVTHKRFVADRIAFDWFIPSDSMLTFASALPSPIQISRIGTTRRGNGYIGRLRGASRGRRGPHLHLALPTALSR